MQKGNIIIYLLVGVLILAVAGGSYYLGTKKTSTLVPVSTTPIVASQTPQPTPITNPDESANWKTYTNTKYGYSLKYEPNSRLKQFNCSQEKAFEKGENLFIMDAIDSSFPECGFGGYTWPVSIEVRQTASDCISGNNYSAKETLVKISEMTAKRCDFKYVGSASDQGPGPSEYAVVVLPKNNSYFTFILGDIGYEKTFNQILSTFKFTN